MRQTSVFYTTRHTRPSSYRRRDGLQTDRRTDGQTDTVQTAGPCPPTNSPLSLHHPRSPVAKQNYTSQLLPTASAAAAAGDILVVYPKKHDTPSPRCDLSVDEMRATCGFTYLLLFTFVICRIGRVLEAILDTSFICVDQCFYYGCNLYSVCVFCFFFILLFYMLV